MILDKYLNVHKLQISFSQLDSSINECYLLYYKVIILFANLQYTHFTSINSLGSISISPYMSQLGDGEKCDYERF
jgi:hypothetical protein